MQVFASQEELGELCRILDEDLESYAGFCFQEEFGELCRILDEDFR